MAHLLEHLLFKGSERYSARYIAESFDAIGAESNAFTSKDNTCFWARLLDRDLPIGLDLLAEMLQRPAFRPHEIDSEHHVVLEEINMNDDDPSDVAHDQFAKALWGDHVLALPVLGTRESIAAMTREVIAGYWKRRYHPATVVIAASGNLEHSALVDLVGERFGDWAGTTAGHDFKRPGITANVQVVEKDTEQAHLVLGSEGLDRADERRFAFGILNHVLGGGMSSRLFREIREERGLAYAVYSFRMPYADSGAFGVYVGTTPHQTAQVLELVREQCAKVAAEGITLDELDRAKGYTKGSLALSMEDTNSRMVRLGRHELTGVEHLSLDETVARIEAVTLQDVHDVAAEVLTGPFVIGAVGPFDAIALHRHIA